MEDRYWLRITTRNVGDKKAVTGDLSNYASWLMDCAFCNGFIIDTVTADEDGFSSVIILKALINSGQLPGLNLKLFRNELILERKLCSNRIKKCEIGDYCFGISGYFPMSFVYTHFVTREVDSKKYVDRGYEMISPEWTDEHEMLPCIRISISKRAGFLELLAIRTKVELKDIPLDDKRVFYALSEGKNKEDCRIESFDDLINELYVEGIRGISRAILEALYRYFDKWYEINHTHTYNMGRECL